MEFSKLMTHIQKLLLISTTFHFLGTQEAKHSSKSMKKYKKYNGQVPNDKMFMQKVTGI
jgi:hypothetical protein